MILRFSFIFMFCITLCSCEAIANKHHTNKLDQALKNYEKALRWAEYRAAASFHVSRDGKPHVIDVEGANDFNVTGINVLEKTVNPEINEAVILAEINYYNKERGTLRRIRQEQHWWRSEESKVWLIESKFPEFK